jgi:hypothetical protein
MPFGEPTMIAGQRRYGCWAGLPNGVPEDKARCIEEVWRSEGNHSYHYQCQRKRGHGPEGLYCKTHTPEAKAAREIAANARYQSHRLDSSIEAARREIVETARKAFKQEASFDELEIAVMNLEALITKRAIHK